MFYLKNAERSSSVEIRIFDKKTKDGLAEITLYHTPFNSTSQNGLLSESINIDFFVAIV